ncbi:MAG: tripartite tricarboxylate transporter substrate binding protein [Burkholderiaceae bacterium]
MTRLTTPTLRTASRALLALSAALWLAPLPAAAQADYPNKPVRFVNAWPPGGPSDLIARSMSDVLQKSLGQPFVVENKPGAGGNIGSDAVAKSAPDGYTVLFGIDSTYTINPHIYKSMPFKPGDLKPLMVIASSGLLIGVNPKTGFKTLADMVKAAQTRSVSFSSGSSGSPGHLAAEIFHESTGGKVLHVPYTGNTPAVTAVLSGEVDAGILATPGMLPHVKAGKITALAVTSRQRSTLAPDIPTVADLGHKEMEQAVYYVAMVPAATPDAIVQKLQKAMADALAQPEVRQRLAGLDLFYEGQTGAAAQQLFDQLSARYAKVIKATGMKVE